VVVYEKKKKKGKIYPSKSKVLPKRKTNGILFYLKDISAFCAFEATFFGSFDKEHKITT
jgi:hypothetical protein